MTTFYSLMIGFDALPQGDCGRGFVFRFGIGTIPDFLTACPVAVFPIAVDAPNQRA